MTTSTRALARHISEMRFADLAAEVVWEAKRRIADVVGAGLSGSTTPVRARAAEFAGKNSRAGSATMWGSSATSSPGYAAFVNGTMAFHLELDDVHRTSHTHPGVTTIPLALAISEEERLSGRDLLLSVVLGYEAQIRIGLAVSPSMYIDRTHLPAGALGAFGAAAAAAKLLGLDEDGVAGALGAASYIGPVAPFESFRLGAPVKDTIMGWANLSGLSAAQLAAGGFVGPETALDGEFGYYPTVSEHHDAVRLHEDLGSRFAILGTGIKPYACCRQHHTAIDAVMALRESEGVEAADVDHVLLRTFVVAARGTDRKPLTVQAAKYSAPFTIALALSVGKNRREDYSMEAVGDQDLLELASRVDVQPDMELEALYDEYWPSVVEITTRDGRTISSRVDLPKGEPEYPISDDELHDKFLSLAGDAVASGRAEEIWSTIFALDDLDDTAKLGSLLQV